MDNTATDLPSNDSAPTALTPLYPDTQNETARNLTKADRMAVMQRVQELILQLKTRVRRAFMHTSTSILPYSLILTLPLFFAFTPLTFSQQQRFDPSEVASQETCMDISKLLPASLDHEEERDKALETLRNLMTTSFDMLNECFIKGGSRDSLKRPNWAVVRDQKELESAMKSLLSNCLWALTVRYIHSQCQGACG